MSASMHVKEDEEESWSKRRKAGEDDQRADPSRQARPPTQPVRRPLHHPASLHLNPLDKVSELSIQKVAKK